MCNVVSILVKSSGITQAKICVPLLAGEIQSGEVDIVFFFLNTKCKISMKLRSSLVEPSWPQKNKLT